MKRSWGLAPCGSVTEPKERPGEVVGGDSKILEMPGSWDVYQGKWRVGSETDLHLLTSYVLRMAEPERWSSPSLLEPEDHRCISEVRHWTLYTVGFWLCFDLITTVPCPPWNKEEYNFFAALQRPTIKRPWIFKKDLEPLKHCNFKDCETYTVVLYFVSYY